MNVQVESELSDEQRLVFMEVIEESLRISHRTHLFNWLQRGLQFLIGHEVMMYGIRSTDSDVYEYEYFTTSRYFGDEQFNAVIHRDTGIVQQAQTLWNKLPMPVFVTHQMASMEFNNYQSHYLEEAVLRGSELKQFVVHGFGDNRTRISTIVVFGRLNAQVDELTAHLLELIMPHLHCALVKVNANRGAIQVYSTQDAMLKSITKREIEILQWLHLGKTNWEISSILDISPLTVKNHVQNIIRKLGVENRGQAALKGVRLGLISQTQ
jgi:transcriptional regulator EpsA